MLLRENYKYSETNKKTLNLLQRANSYTQGVNVGCDQQDTVQ